MIYWFIHILILSFLSYFAFKQLKSSFKPIIFWSAISLKLSLGIILGLIYYHYYGTGDSIIFFDKASEMAKLSALEHWYTLIADSSYANNNHPRDLFFIKILSVFAKLTGSSYWIISLYLSFFSFIASWYFVITFIRIYPKYPVVTLISFLFIPSVVFWSSGILKDTISSTALVFSVAILLKGVYLKRSSILEIVIGSILLFLLFHLKHYLFITITLFGALLFSLYLIKSSTKKIRWLFATAIFTITLFTTQHIHPYFKIDRIPQTIFEINKTILENSSTLDQNLVTVEEPTWNAVGRLAPYALFTGLFRPSIFNTTVAFGWIHRIENLILIIFSILSILILIKDKPNVDFELLIPALICISVLATMLALTTPNFGSLVRYRNAFLPFLFLIVSILPHQYLSSKAKE